MGMKHFRCSMLFCFLLERANNTWMIIQKHQVHLEEDFWSRKKKKSPCTVAGSDFSSIYLFWVNKRPVLIPYERPSIKTIRYWLYNTSNLLRFPPTVCGCRPSTQGIILKSINKTQKTAYLLLWREYFRLLFSMSRVKPEWARLLLAHPRKDWRHLTKETPNFFQSGPPWRAFVHLTLQLREKQDASSPEWANKRPPPPTAFGPAPVCGFSSLSSADLHF